MSVFSHTQDALPAFRGMREAKNNSQSTTAPSSHVAMIKRFARFALTLAGFVTVVTAIASLKLAIYLPQFFH